MNSTKPKTTFNELKRTSQLKEEISSRNTHSEKSDVASLQELISKKVKDKEMLKKACHLLEEWLNKSKAKK